MTNVRENCTFVYIYISSHTVIIIFLCILISPYILTHHASLQNGIAAATHTTHTTHEQEAEDSRPPFLSPLPNATGAGFADRCVTPPDRRSAVPEGAALPRPPSPDVSADMLRSLYASAKEREAKYLPLPTTRSDTDELRTLHLTEGWAVLGYFGFSGCEERLLYASAVDVMLILDGARFSRSTAQACLTLTVKFLHGDNLTPYQHKDPSNVLAMERHVLDHWSPMTPTTYTFLGLLIADRDRHRKACVRALDATLRRDVRLPSVVAADIAHGLGCGTKMLTTDDSTD